MQGFLSQARILITKSPKHHSIRRYGHIITGPGLHRRRNLTTMATSSDLQLFVIWAPDYTDEGAFDRRLAVREQHLSRAEENKKKGYVTSKLAFIIVRIFDLIDVFSYFIIEIAAPFLTPESIATPDAPKKLVGSMLLVRGMFILFTRLHLTDNMSRSNFTG